MIGETSERTFTEVFVAFKNSPALLGASALANVYITTVLLGLSPNASVLVVPLVAVAVYVLDDVIDRLEGGDDEFEPKSREAFYSSPLLVGAVAVGAYVLALVIAATRGGPLAVALTLVPGVSGALYSLPWLFAARATRVKDVFLLNTALIAGAIAIPGTLLPVAFASEPVPVTATAALTLFWFVRYVVGVETCNVPDLEDDRRGGVATLPTNYGIDTTRKLLYAGDLLALSLLLAFVLPVSGRLPVALMLPFLGLSIGFTYALERPSLRGPICVGWDGIHVLMGVVVAVGVNVAAL